MLRPFARRPTGHSEASSNGWSFRRIDIPGMIGLFGLLLITATAAFPQLFMPYDPQLRVGPALLPPSMTHPFGTDEIGRDLFSRVILGIRFTWLPGMAIIGASFVVGTAIGLVSGFVGGWLDAVFRRVNDVFLTVPSMLFAIAFAALLGPGVENSVVAIAVCWWPWYAWIARDEVRRILASPHYLGAKVSGASRSRLVFRYALPGVVPALIVAAGVDVSNVVMTLSLMSFLGLGQPDPAPELGALVSRSLDSLTMFWWLPILPSLAIFLICFLANLFADGVRHALKGR
ncbi:ABC transporter permease (plasmid) [Agrobacterium sp. 33MFTa1.1]|nr:ABC transporter permease [Agrobacterium sp. 33MFTa1.1]